MAGAIDTFVGQQSFWGRRRIAQLAQLGSMSADLDFHTVETWEGASPERVADEVLESLQDARLPQPSYILATGRGLLVTWLHDLVPRAALPRWMACQKHIAATLRPFGADARAIDAARVFRVAATVNSKSGTAVRPIFMAAPAAKLQRWDFDALADEILPIQRADLIALRVRRAERKARGGMRPPNRILTAATLWEAVLTDLQRLRMLRWFGPLPPGQRDTWLFLAANSIAWLAPPMVLERELTALAQEAGGWPEGETRARMSSVLRRAQVAATGGKIEWQGRTVDPRYRFRAQTIVDWLQISPGEMRDAGLRVLVDADRRRELSMQRMVDSRRRAGMQPRPEWQTAKKERAARAKALRAGGMTWQAIADMMELPTADAARKLATRAGDETGQV